MEDLKNFPEMAATTFKSLAEGLGSGIDEMRRIMGDIYTVFAAIGDFFAWLGLYGSLLLGVTLIVLYLLSLVSPMERRANYLLAVGVGSLLAYLKGFTLDAYGRYLLVMGLPVVIPYLLMWAWVRVKNIFVKARGSEGKEAVLEQLLGSTAEFQKTGDVQKLKKELSLLVTRL